MTDQELERECRKCLSYIFAYIGVDTKYAEYAALITQLENLVERCK
jgi:hypothetical protein